MERTSARVDAGDEVGCLALNGCVYAVDRRFLYSWRGSVEQSGHHAGQCGFGEDARCDIRTCLWRDFGCALSDWRGGSSLFDVFGGFG